MFANSSRRRTLYGNPDLGKNGRIYVSNLNYLFQRGGSIEHFGSPSASSDVSSFPDFQTLFLGFFKLETNESGAPSRRNL